MPTQLIGTWRLVSRVTTLSSGQQFEDKELGSKALGYLVYDETGHVFAQLMRPNRTQKEMEGCSNRIEAGANNSSNLCGYSAYFGTYTLVKEGEVVHHIEGSLAPADVGNDVHRTFAIEGNRLTIALPTTTPDGQKATRTLIWERVK